MEVSVDADTSLSHLVSDLAVLLGSNVDAEIEAEIDASIDAYDDANDMPEESILSKVADPDDDPIITILRDTAIIAAPETTLIPSDDKSISIHELWDTWNNYQELRMKLKQQHEGREKENAVVTVTPTTTATTITCTKENAGVTQEPRTRPSYDRNYDYYQYYAYYQYYQYYVYYPDCTILSTIPYHLDEARPSWSLRHDQYARSSQVSAAENLQKFVNSEYQLT